MTAAVSQTRKCRTVSLPFVLVLRVVKIVLRGLNGVGKTSLFDVFQGKSCPEAYVPSKEINTTHVLWTNPATKNRVKVGKGVCLSYSLDRDLGCRR